MPDNNTYHETNKVFARKVLVWAKDEGLNLIPVHYKQKKPSVKWKTYQKKLSPDEQRTTWFLSNKRTNYAVICGKVSNNLFVVDVDSSQLAKILKNKFPETTVVRPSIGLHFYFFSKTPVKKRRLEFIDQKDTLIGVDIQAEGSYVLCPPSIHPDPPLYVPYQFISLNKIPIVDYEDILEIIHAEANKLGMKFKPKKKDYARVQTTARFNEMVELLPPLEEMIGFDGSGPHPIHGSSGGTNLSVNSDEQLWYCFRHQVGGSKVQWYAIQEGIIDCANITSVTKEDYRKIFEKIEERYKRSKITGEKETLEEREWMKYFREAFEKQMLDPTKAYCKYIHKENSFHTFGLDKVLESATNVREAIAILKKTKEAGGMYINVINNELRMQITAQVIISDLLDRGFFIKDQQEILYYFNEETKKVFYLSYNREKTVPEFKAYISEQYIPLRTDKICDEVVYYAIEHHEKREVYILFYYEEEEGVLYIFNRKNEYYRLDGKTVTIHPNGKHVLFRPENLDKITYLPLEKRENPYRKIKTIPGVFFRTDDFLLDILVNRSNFSDSYLTANEQRLQLAIHLYAFPFRTYLRTKPIMAWVGGRGSLKSFSNTQLGMFLLNPDYAIRKLPYKEDDFVIGLINNPYYFLDNLKGEPRWLAETLAAIATGAAITRRKLYSTGKEALFKPSCFLSINSIDPICQGPDVVDRMLIFHTAHPEKYFGEKIILEPLLKYRDELWSLYIDDLNAITNALKKKRGKKFQQTNHRLADWAILGKNVNKALKLDKKYEVDFKQFYQNLDREKAAFPLENDPLLPALRCFVEEYKNQWMSAKEIADQLRSYETGWEGSHQELAQHFRVLKNNLDILYGFRDRKTKKLRRKEYYFGRNPP